QEAPDSCWPAVCGSPGGGGVATRSSTRLGARRDWSSVPCRSWWFQVSSKERSVSFTSRWCLIGSSSSSRLSSASACIRGCCWRGVAPNRSRRSKSRRLLCDRLQELRQLHRLDQVFGEAGFERAT